MNTKEFYLETRAPGVTYAEWSKAYDAAVESRIKMVEHDLLRGYDPTRDKPARNPFFADFERSYSNWYRLCAPGRAGFMRFLESAPRVRELQRRWYDYVHAIMEKRF